MSGPVFCGQYRDVLALLPFLLQATSITLPAFTAYPVPNPDGARVTREGAITGWSSSETRIEWGGYFRKAGRIHISAQIDLPSEERASYELDCGRGVLAATAAGTGVTSTVDLGNLNIAKPGWQVFWLRGTTRTGSSFGTLQSLTLEGDAVQDAKFNLKPRRNSASVHIWYPVGEDTEWFYNEVTAEEDPLATYYMACGFSRGYFGMQVNGPRERRIIFSIWDSGNEAVDRSRVAPEDQVQLLAKGEGVYASGFGNEGTGGHSHWVYPWKTHVAQKFLVHAEPKGAMTIYTAYFWASEEGGWRLIASFSAPHDGKLLRGLYSFVEDFNGDNGNLKRKALYGPAWIHTTARGWEPLVTARFTHDGTGGKDRIDYDFGIENDRYFLQNGGFQGASPETGATMHFDRSDWTAPVVDLKKLERLVH